MNALRVGSVLAGRFRIEELIGRGGSGAVYRVWDQHADVERALKVHDAGASAGNWSWRLRREFYQMSQLVHPGIVRVHDWGEEGPLLFYTMDLIVGRDAGDLAPMRPSDVLDLMVCMAAALGLVHSRGLVHQDVKPRNIRIPDADVDDKRDRPALRAMLMDFGLLAPLGVMRDEGQIAGTPGYVAPEVLVGAPADARSDLYSLGVTAHVLLTGVLPQQAVGWLSAPLALDLPAQVSAPFGQLVADLLAPDPARRPADTAELLERLRSLTDAVPSGEAAAPAYLASPPLVGRATELGRLRTCWSRASQGRGGAAYLLARPGLGRTRLLRSLALELRVAGASVVEIAGERLKPPMGAIHRLLENLVVDRGRSAAEPGFRSEGARLLEELVRFQELAESSGERSATELTLLRRAIIAWLGRLSVTRPLVIFVDDLQWCDHASDRTLRDLAASAAEHALLVVAAIRLEDDQDLEEEAARLRRNALDVLGLAPLGAQDAAALWRNLFGGLEIAQAVLDPLIESSAGNPSLVIEIASSLVDDGVAAFERGRWRLAARQLERVRLPQTLEQALVERLSRLTPQARRLAEALAVVGMPADGPLLAEVAELKDAQLFAALDELSQRHVVSLQGRGGAGTVWLTHARLGEVLYGGLQPATRADLHRQVGRLLRRRARGGALDQSSVDSLDARIGYHLGRGGPEVELEAAPWLRSAAQLAFGAGHYGDCLPLLRELALLYERHGGPAQHPELLDVWQYLGIAAVGYQPQLTADAFAKIRSYLDRHGTFSAVTRSAGTVGSRLAVLSGFVSGALRRMRSEGLRSALQAGDDLARYAIATGYAALSQGLIGDLEDARRSVEVLQRLTEARGGVYVAFAHLGWVGWGLGSGAFETVLNSTRRVTELLEPRPDAIPTIEIERSLEVAKFSRAWVALLRGEAYRQGWIAGNQLVWENHNELLTLQGAAIPTAYHAQRGEVTLMLGSRATFLARCLRLRATYHETLIYLTSTPLLAEAGQLARVRDDLRAFQVNAPPGPYRDIWLLILEGASLLASGYSAEAAVLLDRGAARAEGADVRSDLWFCMATFRSAAAWLAERRPDEAEARAREVVARSQSSELRNGWLEARARRVLLGVALLRQELDVAAAESATLFALASRLENPGDQAHAELLSARVLQAQSRSDQALALAAEAEAHFAQLGNNFMARQAQELIASCGGATLRVAELVEPQLAIDAETLIDPSCIPVDHEADTHIFVVANAISKPGRDS